MSRRSAPRRSASRGAPAEASQTPAPAPAPSTSASAPPRREPAAPQRIGRSWDSRLLVLRVRLREIRAELAAARRALRLAAAGVLVGASAFVVWLLGHLGFQLGAAPMLGLPDLESTSGGLATGVRMLVNLPVEVHRASLEDPFRLVIAFAAVAVPAALLPLAILLRQTGEFGRDPAVRRLGGAAATLAMVATALAIAWIAAPYRAARLSPLPSETVLAEAWLSGRSTVAGLDALAAIGMVLWVVLLSCADMARWLRGLATTIALGGAAAMLVAAASSNGAAAELDRPLASIKLSSESDPTAMLGQAMGGPALLRRVGSTNVIDLQSVIRGAVVGRTSVREMLSAPDAEPASTQRRSP